MKIPKHLGRSVLIGGCACGLVSLIPIVNFLNLLLMLWMGVGGYIAVHLLKKDNPDLGTGNAILAGGLSGLLGGIIFSAASAWVASGIPAERVEKIISLISILFPGAQEETEEFFSQPQFGTLLFTVLAVAVVVSILTGMAGGWIAGKTDPKTDPNDPDSLEAADGT
jgi:hypothetical protein